MASKRPDSSAVSNGTNLVLLPESRKPMIALNFEHGPQFASYARTNSCVSEAILSSCASTRATI